MSVNSPDPPASTHRLPMGPTAPPDIKVIFRGFIITNIRHGTNMAMIGALDPAYVADAACHKPIIHLYRISSEDEGEVTTELKPPGLSPGDEYSLTVEGQSGIEVFQKDDDDFNHLDEIENDKKDFRWFVDLNKVLSRPDANRIKISTNKLKPKFFLNNGVFHASKLSDGEVNIEWPDDLTRHPKRFGRFAVEITARIVLTGDVQAVFRNGSDALLRMGGLSETNRYEIVFDCTCRSRHENTSDFGDVYQVITGQDDNPIPLKERVGFESRATLSLNQARLNDPKAQVIPSTEDIDKTPEVYCSGGNG